MGRATSAVRPETPFLRGSSTEASEIQRLHWRSKVGRHFSTRAASAAVKRAAPGCRAASAPPPGCGRSTVADSGASPGRPRPNRRPATSRSAGPFEPALPWSCPACRALARRRRTRHSSCRRTSWQSGLAVRGRGGSLARASSRPTASRGSHSTEASVVELGGRHAPRSSTREVRGTSARRAVSTGARHPLGCERQPDALWPHLDVPLGQAPRQLLGQAERAPHLYDQRAVEGAQDGLWAAQPGAGNARLGRCTAILSATWAGRRPTRLAAKAASRSSSGTRPAGCLGRVMARRRDDVLLRRPCGGCLMGSGRRYRAVCWDVC